MIKQELLAPAGDAEAGYAALYYGADAVYLGLSKFSARATATNFDEETLDQFTAYAHHLHRKVYVALNTVIQEDELSGVIESLNICARCNIDGLIIQDLGVASIMKEKYPQFELHASTQMAIHNKEGALFLQKLGFKRVVLARELSLAEIKEIAAVPDLETEAFIHGALCYSYSGLCQFSAIEHGRSANRGKCLYPCRAAFTINGKKEHLFSMKDMALQEDILKMPVTSLKIEGRKKSALYVAAVTDYYRHILDGKGADYKKEERIKQIFSRPWCKFHFNGKTKDIIDRDFVGHRGLSIGKVEQISHGWLTFTTNHKISRYDGIQIDVKNNEKPFGFSLKKLSTNKKICIEANAGSKVNIQLPQKYPQIKNGDTIYLSSSSEVKGSYPYVKPKIGAFRNTDDIKVNITIKDNVITATCGNFSATENGNFSQAENADNVKKSITDAFSKTGNTKFNLKELNIDNEGNLFVPISILNKLRRNLYEKIEISNPIIELPQNTTDVKHNEKPKFIIKIDNLEYLNLLDLHNFEEIIVLINFNQDIKSLLSLPKNKIRIALPAVCRTPNKFKDIIYHLLDMGYKKWEVANYWPLNMLPINQLDISFDSSIYMLNTQAIEYAKEIGASRVTLSIEDNFINICNIAKKSPLKTVVIIYQDIPLFTSVGCIRDNDCKNCTRSKKWFTIEKDGKTFNALSSDCQMMMFDKLPYCIASDANKIQTDFLRMDFTYKDYNAEKVFNIVNKLLSFNDVCYCIKGNIYNNYI